MDKFETSIVNVILNACSVYLDELSPWKSQYSQARIYWKRVWLSWTRS